MPGLTKKPASCVAFASTCAAYSYLSMYTQCKCLGVPKGTLTYSHGFQVVGDRYGMKAIQYQGEEGH